jgi:hypothetical protein
MSILNKSVHCDCGAKKDTRRQWCRDCYDLLSPFERDEFAQRLSNLRQIIGVLQKRITERRQRAAEQYHRIGDPT